MPTTPVGRLAPSPSGRLHLGHARTFALAWAQARSRGGRVVLRLEDLDQSRCRPEHVQRTLRDLEWLGIEWDGPVLYQSQRLEPLREAAARLERMGVAYRCICTRADLEQAVQAPQRGVSELRYPGTCRARGLDQQSALPGRSALRFRVPEGPISFSDGIAGPQSFDVSAEVGDFAISSRTNVPSYQLAVVVDDAEQGVTEVFRGDDLLSSTPRQILLQQALGLPRPEWFHAPLVLDAQGRRLAKRADDLSLETLRESGVDARAILGWVGGSAGLAVPERITATELASAYDLTHLCRRPVSLSEADIDRLRAARA
ncbi:MAG TPA: tRNA glutamyl-Q(34) synthetase GluQRS [Polyangiaceae bacterium]|nr:tRNA glutamyl-Q(34) synthetase GluQRS [Polyangiaceae bacterium]